MERREDPTDVLKTIRQKVARQIEIVNQRLAAEKAELERTRIAPVRSTIANIDNEFNTCCGRIEEDFNKQRLPVEERLGGYSQTRQDINEKITQLNCQLDEIDKFEKKDKVKLEQLSKDVNHQLQELKAVKVREMKKPLADLARAESELREKEKRSMGEVAAKKTAEDQTIKSILSIWAEESLLDESSPQLSLETPQQPLATTAEVSQSVRIPPTRTTSSSSVLPSNIPEPPGGEPPAYPDKERDQLANSVAWNTSTVNGTSPSSPTLPPLRPRDVRESSEISEVLSEIFVSNPNSNSGSTPPLQSDDQNGEENDFGFVFSVSPDGYYISPDCMKGVPIAKITENSDYWISSWTNAQTCIEDEKQSPKEVENTLKWFDDCCHIHPNQLVSKGYYDKKGLLNRNYVTSLRKIFQNLSAAGVADPVKWLRIRLALIIRERDGQPGIGFRLKQTLYDFKKTHTEYIDICKTLSIEESHVKPNKTKGGKRSQKTNSRSNPPSPYAKREQHNVQLSPSHRPPKMQRMETRTTSDIYDIPECDKSPTTKMQNNFSSQQAPSSASPDRSSTTPRRLPAPRIQPTDPTYRSSSAFRIPKYEASFDLSFLRCGVQKWDKPNCPIQMRLNAETKIFDPYNGDASLIALQPELAIKPNEVAGLEFVTRYDQGDSVILHRPLKPGETGWAGDGTKIILAFKCPDDADRFVVSLCELNGNITMSQADRKRVIIHTEAERSLSHTGDQGPALSAGAFI